MISHDMFYIVQTAVMVAVAVMMSMQMPMSMVKALLFRPIDSHRNMRPGNPAFYSSLSLDMHPRYPKGVHLSQKLIPVRQKFQQCRCQHVPGSTHSTV